MWLFRSHLIIIVQIALLRSFLLPHPCYVSIIIFLSSSAGPLGHLGQNGSTLILWSEFIADPMTRVII
jgi:hypothetical protein